MRRPIILLFSLLIVCAVGFGCFHVQINGTQDLVTWEQNTLMGDPAVVNGLNIQTRNAYYRRLLWETSCTLDDELDPVTEFDFSNESHDYGYSGRRSSDMYFYPFTSIGECYGDSLTDAVKEKYPELVKDFTDSIENTEQYGEFTINLADYMDYYALEGEITIENYVFRFTEFSLNYDITDEKLTRAINDYIKIPMDDLIIRYTVDKRTSGLSMGFEAFSDCPYGIGVAAADAVYFTFDAVGDNGQILDTSLIPGGYGIYRLAYTLDESGVHFDYDSIETVFSLDPGEDLLGLELSYDGKRLHLQSWKDSILYLRVYDLETMNLIQRLEIAQEQDDCYLRVTQHDGFYTILEYQHDNENQDTLRVLEEQADGTFTVEFTVPMNHASVSLTDVTLLDYYSMAIAYNGEVLAVAFNATQEKIYWKMKACDFLILAYDAGGMIYAGEYQVNLSDLHTDLYGTGDITPFGYRPIDIWW